MNQTQIIKTNVVLNGIIYQISNHFIHNWFLILTKHQKWNNWYIHFHQLIFDTIYCEWFECQFEYFNNLLYIGPMFLLHYICYMGNMKLMNCFLLEFIPYLFLPCFSMRIDIDFVLLLFLMEHMLEKYHLVMDGDSSKLVFIP